MGEFGALGLDPLLCNRGRDIILLCFVRSSLSGGRATACPGIIRAVLPKKCVLDLFFP